jgi:hypothetical protein
MLDPFSPSNGAMLAIITTTNNYIFLVAANCTYVD